MSTVFEKIIAREIPGYIIYEDEHVAAFLDINPITTGHALVVPKKAFVNAFDIPSETLAQMARVAQMIALRQHTTLNAEGVNFFMSSGEAAGQEVPHAHLHVIPRNLGDHAIPTSFPISKTSPEELAAIAEKLR